MLTASSDQILKVVLTKRADDQLSLITFLDNYWIIGFFLTRVLYKMNILVENRLNLKINKLVNNRCSYWPAYKPPSDQLQWADLSMQGLN